MAAPSIGITVEPAGIGTPPSSVSRVATRVMVSSGASQRTASSIACGISDRSARTASSCIRIGEQAEEQVAQRAVGGLDAGGQQQPQERVDLLVGELLPVDLGLRRGG